MTVVLTLGGSIVAPNTPDVAYLRNFCDLVREWLKEDDKRRLIIVVGGGAAARQWQNAYKDIQGKDVQADSLDWIGIMATRLNAELVKACFGDLCPQDVVYDPTQPSLFTGRILLAAGWKPGFSTDFDSVILAERFSSDIVVCLSNISRIYTADPKLEPDAKAIDNINWKDFRAIVGDEWIPGKNTPFDPIASRRADELGLKLIFAGKDLDNFRAILDGRDFFGSTVEG